MVTASQHGDQAALLQPVAERDEQEHAEDVADLGEGDQPAGGRLAHVEDVAQRGQQGLGVVQVGDRHARGGGQEHDQPSRHTECGRAGGPARGVVVARALEDVHGSVSVRGHLCASLIAAMVRDVSHLRRRWSPER
ncbi:hypothetical protein ACRJ4B_42750 [Streptomyces sp. GTA36]